MTRFRSEDAFASLDRQDWPEIAVKACRLAIRAAGVDDTTALDALRALERRTVDAEAAASMCELADRFDQAAWDAQAASDYDVLFRRARAVSALAFALSEEPDEAIYEAAHAVGTPEDLVRQLGDE
ncbi:MAG: hypothetical protein HOQ28_10905 [Thermoleophilia bacterium]|nr:hypothetical protein [Thermoleophilia bacterium]